MLWTDLVVMRISEMRSIVIPRVAEMKILRVHLVSVVRCCARY